MHDGTTQIGQNIAQYASLDKSAFVSSFAGVFDVSLLRSAAGILIYFMPNFQNPSQCNFALLDSTFHWARKAK